MHAGSDKNLTSFLDLEDLVSLCIAMHIENGLAIPSVCLKQVLDRTCIFHVFRIIKASFESFPNSCNCFLTSTITIASALLQVT